MDASTSASIIELLRSGAILRASLDAELGLFGHSSFASADADPDGHRVEKRAKQVEHGRNTLGYELYRLAVPRASRRRGDPATPDATRVTTKRAWALSVRRWRRELHLRHPLRADELLNSDGGGARGGAGDGARGGMGDVTRGGAGGGARGGAGGGPRGGAGGNRTGAGAAGGARGEGARDGGGDDHSDADGDDGGDAAHVVTLPDGRRTVRLMPLRDGAAGGGAGGGGGGGAGGALLLALAYGDANPRRLGRVAADVCTDWADDGTRVGAHDAPARPRATGAHLAATDAAALAPGPGGIAAVVSTTPQPGAAPGATAPPTAPPPRAGFGAAARGIAPPTRGSGFGAAVFGGSAGSTSLDEALALQHAHLKNKWMLAQQSIRLQAGIWPTFPPCRAE
jgi:hypothetical protein